MDRKICLKFLLKIFLFSTPLILIMLIASFIAIKSKENYYNIDAVIKANEKYLIGYAYNDSVARYIKYKTIAEHDKFTIIAIGSSRVLQFREEMFKKSFYNAGYTVSSICDFEMFLKTIPKEKYPNYLIMGIDPWMFNEAADSLNKNRQPTYWSSNPTISFVPKWEYFRNILGDIFKGKITFSNIQTKHKYITIGLNALINTDGFRKDGSRASGLVIPKLLRGDTSLINSNFQVIKYRIENQIWPAFYADKINLHAVSVLERFLSFCMLNKIQVIGFITPYADWAQKKIIDSDKYGYLDQINPTLKPVFDKYKFEYYYYPSVKYCDSDDSETLDGGHGGEKTYLKILINMLKSGSSLNKVCNITKLERDLNSTQNRYVVYNY